jgi:hypothetical protein
MVRKKGGTTLLGEGGAHTKVLEKTCFFGFLFFKCGRARGAEKERRHGGREAGQHTSESKVGRFFL